MRFKSRKETRKELRQAKKVKKHEFYLKNKAKVKGDKSKSQKNIKNQSDQINRPNSISNKQLQQTEEGKFKNNSKKFKKNFTKNLKKEFKTPQDRIQQDREREKREREKLERDIEKVRRDKLKADNEKEEIEIKRLEKQMKLKKGKSKAFVLDGLDYLLDVCDKKISENEFEKALQESESDADSDMSTIFEKNSKGQKRKLSECESKDINSDGNESDFVNSEDDDDFDDEVVSGEEELNSSEGDYSESENILKNSVKRKNQNDKRVKFADEKERYSKLEKKSCIVDDDDDDDNDIDDNIIDEDDDDDEESGVNRENNEIKEKNETSVDNKKLWEDIYGRTRDESGNIIKTYVPPQLRKNSGEHDEKKSEKLLKLKRQLKGLLNRLAESNMAYISNQVEQLYMNNSRNDMNETIFGLFKDSLFTEILTSDRMITEHAMLVAVLHSNIGSEVGAYFLQHSVMEFKRALEGNLCVEIKDINNILIFIMHLYNFQLFKSKLMYDIISELSKNLEEKQIELLLLTFKTVGFNLRKDDPIALKNLILNVQQQVNSMTNQEGSSRVKFMLEILKAIKNNNMSKIPNYNPELVEKLRKSLKVFVRKGNYSTELNISLQELINAEKYGRWWIVGSAWSGVAPSGPNSEKSQASAKTTVTKYNQKLLDLAKKMRMNTDVRQNIFCILMSSEDFLEAFEKLIKLKLKGSVEREIMNVLLHCALQEKESNPYYVYLANKFCAFDRKYQIMLQCTVWDKIKNLQSLLPIQIKNLAKFMGNIILEKGLPISVLKVIEFSDLDKATIKFMTQVLVTILLAEDQTAAAAVFKRISESKTLRLFRESLRLFLQHFVAKKMKKIGKEESVRLSEMLKVADRCLTVDGETEF